MGGAGGVPLGKLALLAAAVWLGALLYTSDILSTVGRPSPSSSADNGDGGADVRIVERRLKRMAQDVEHLRRENEALRGHLRRSSGSAADAPPPPSDAYAGRLLAERGGGDTGLPPPPQSALGHYSWWHEDARRTVHNGIVELWYSVRGHVRSLNATLGGRPEERLLARASQAMAEQFRSVLADAARLRDVDGAGEHRRAALANLTELVQRRLAASQNPPAGGGPGSGGGCAKVRSLVCRLNKGCGFGCQLHHAVYCLMLAYGSSRVLLLDTTNWRYAKNVGWTGVFQPVSRTCDWRSVDPRLFESAAPYHGPNQTELVVQLPIIDALRLDPTERPAERRAADGGGGGGLRSVPWLDFDNAQLPQAIPEELAGELVRLHDYPPAWWIGQFVHYLMRPSEHMLPYLDQIDDKLDYDGDRPIVGVHVRRTDKVGSEAAFHPVDEYFHWVEQWFATEELVRAAGPLPRRVFLATDDAQLLGEARAKYPHYEIVGDAKVAQSAQLGRRYSDASLKGVIGDVHALARTHYLVCTFSSQVCRLAYELMQVSHGGRERGAAFHSLDDVFYFGGQLAHEQVAVLPHQPATADELPLRAGDRLAVAGNHWDGWSKGRLLADGRRVGLYPSYKVRQAWRLAKFPTGR